MATSGSLSNSYRGWTYKIEWSAKQSIELNQSVITCVHKLVLASSYRLSIYGRTNSCTIDGVTKNYSSPSISSDGNTTITLGTTTHTVSHNTDGTKKDVPINGSFNINAQLSGVQVDAIKISGTITLDTIPRYATSVQSLVSKTETDIEMSWSSDSIIDYMEYSTDNGSSWVGKAVSNVKSGSYTISGLKANTTYKIKTRVRKKEGQLTTDSAVLSVTTYNFPNCTSTPDFTLGDAVTLKFYNPLSRAFKFYIIGNGTQIATEYSCSTTSYKGLNGISDSVPQLYATIPNSQSGKYKVKVVYGNSTITTDNGNTFAIKGTEVPSLGSVSYADTDTKVQNLTGNNQLIVQNQSKLTVMYTEATAKNSATISEYIFSLNDTTKRSTSPGGTVEFGKVNSSNNLTLTMTVIDSRGLSATTSINVSMKAYTPPNAVVTLERLNNYEDETYLTVDASVTDISGNNEFVICYLYKAQGDDDFGEAVLINDKERNTFSLDKNTSHTFRIIIVDSFGEMWTNDFSVGKGVFPLFINTKKNLVGINDFPQDGEALRVAGGDVRLADGKIRGDQNRILWSGMELMDENATIKLAETISSQLIGVFLVFSPYAEVGSSHNSSFNYIFIPKIHTMLHNGMGVVFRMSGGTPFRYQASKYLYIHDDKIIGNASNIATGTGDSGVIYNNNLYALRYVIGV